MMGVPGADDYGDELAAEGPCVQLGSQGLVHCATASGRALPLARQRVELEHWPPSCSACRPVGQRVRVCPSLEPLPAAGEAPAPSPGLFPPSTPTAQRGSAGQHGASLLRHPCPRLTLPAARTSDASVSQTPMWPLASLPTGPTSVSLPGRRTTAPGRVTITGCAGAGAGAVVPWPAVLIVEPPLPLGARPPF